MTAVVNPAGTMSPDSQSVAIALTTPSGPTLPYLLAVPSFLSGFSTQLSRLPPLRALLKPVALRA